MHDIADGQFDDLAASGAGDVGHLQHLGGDVARRGAFANRSLDPGDQCVVEIDALLELHEQHQPDIRLPVLSDDQGFGHLGSFST